MTSDPWTLLNGMLAEGVVWLFFKYGGFVLDSLFIATPIVCGSFYFLFDFFFVVQ